jgi:hypothetical protein
MKLMKTNEHKVMTRTFGIGDLIRSMYYSDNNTDINLLTY